ncbi:MAG: hypothetical protein KDC07_04765 [Chitinophagaceae bacterium]|nr:hypothetical protein [Chitinophagaceae bacterium]MCB9047135.1 hypothetical protein [Chitinophagales bacterium]
MKQLFRIFLSLTLLLLNVYSSIQAIPQLDGAGIASVEKELPPSPGTSLSHDAGATAGSHFNQVISFKRFYRIVAEENEDEIQEVGTIKKQVARNDYFTTYYPPVQGNSYNISTECLQSRKHLSFYATDRYITLRVFRV